MLALSSADVIDDVILRAGARVACCHGDDLGLRRI